MRACGVSSCSHVAYIYRIYVRNDIFIERNPAESTSSAMAGERNQMYFCVRVTTTDAYEL